MTDVVTITFSHSKRYTLPKFLQPELTLIPPFRSSSSFLLLLLPSPPPDGTTDVTRTTHYGTPTPFQIEAYTRVLMGNIDLALLTFPEGTGDSDVDIVARK